MKSPPAPKVTGLEQPPGASSGRPRIDVLDVLRGFALCGILLANIKPIAHIGTEPVVQPVAAANKDGAWLWLVVDQCFFPIFSLLFGVGFSLLLDSVGGRRLLLLGSALVRYGVIDRIEQSVRVPAALGLVFAAGAVPVLWLRIESPADGAAVNLWFALGGLLVAGTYVCALLLLYRTPLRPVLRGFSRRWAGWR